MGVLNVTPNSFSDGGRWLDADVAAQRGLELVQQGADVVEVGGESTRPGAQRPTVEEERRRVLPVIRSLAAAGVLVGVDTMRAAVAEDAVEAGARMVNDVSGGLADTEMLPFIARAKVPYVCMHWRGHSSSMQSRATYADVVDDVYAELRARVDAVLAAGVEPGRLIVDPGLGYAKSADHNWALLAALERFIDMGYPVLLAASRKSFLGSLLSDPASGNPRRPDQRDDATAAISVLGAAMGVWCIRAHAVATTADVVRVAARLRP
jgi:dihydropteroate synthase